MAVSHLIQGLNGRRSSESSTIRVQCNVTPLFHAGADPGFDQGGAPDHDRPKLRMVHSSIMRVK